MELNFTLIACQLIALLIGFSLHEAGHAYAAKFLGDDTSQRLGRLTLNPIPHLDLFGSIILPLMLIFLGSPFIFAAAKPVPVNPNNFKRPFADFAFVAAAGPMVNVVLFCLGATLLPLAMGNELLLTFLVQFILINMTLAFFNLLPIPPLDGSKILAGFLPRKLSQQLVSMDRIGFLILVLVIIVGRQTGFDILGTWLGFWRTAVAPTLGFFSNLL